MQRRLTTVLVALTLFAVLLVGAGILTLAQVGARNEAELRVAASLESVSGLSEDLSADLPSLDRLAPAIARLGVGFDRGDLHVVTVTADGNVVDQRRRAATTDRAALEPFVLGANQTEALLAGEVIFLDRGNTVVGMQVLNATSPRLEQLNLKAAVVVRRPIGALPDQATKWFLLSAALAVGASVLVASVLARRFVAPIKAIQAATTQLAGGELSARVEVRGNDEVAELGESVNRMAADLERSRLLEQQFLMSVSHDLRTPLTSISGYAEALVDDAIDDPAQAGRIIQSNAVRLSRLVSDLLDLAKLDARQFTVRPSMITPGDTIGRTIDGLVPTARQHGLDLTYDCRTSRRAELDPDRLGQVVANLVENAIKYADRQILVVVEEDANGGIQVNVQDDGPGISGSDLPHVFERLYVTSRRPLREENSSGLGLAIVRDLTVAMGGTVTAGASSLGGTSMVLQFPDNSV